MNLLKFIVKRKILVSLVTVLVLMVGSYSIIKLDKELLPSIEFDGAFVEVYAGEMPAIEVERNITTPLEKKILAIDGVEEVHTKTNIGRSSFQISFERGRGDELVKEVESVVHSSTGEISEVKDVYVGQYGTDQKYEFFMDVSGGDMKEMTHFAKNVLEPRLEDLDEVSDVSLVGIQENEISIQFNREEIMKKGLNITEVIGVIQQANSESTLGELSGEKDSPTLRWKTKLENVKDVENIQIPTPEGFIDLKEIADVSVEQVENSSYVWKNGTTDFVFVQVGRVSDVTQIEMAKAVREELQKIRDENLVKGFELHEMVAQADYVQDSIDSVTNNIMIGAAIAIAILILFLRNFRATFIIGLAIPTSILLTFAMMWVLDYSFNLLTLIGLGLGIGMMVDSAIVILESIYRKKEEGLTKFDAVIEGSKEVATAVIASMLTTIVVFLPIGLIGGEMGRFMIILSSVVAITLISSVLISFTLIPSLSENFLKLRKLKKERKNGLIMRGYTGFVSKVVNRKRNSIAVVATFFIMFAASLFLITKIPMTIMPDMFNRYAELIVNTETGLSLEEKEEIVQEMNERLQSIQDVESNYIIDNGSMYYIIINMTKGDNITREQKEINEEILSSLRELEKSYPITNVNSAMSSGGGSPVQVNITGESFEELKTIANDLMEDLKNIEGIVGITNSIERTSIEEVIELKKEEIENAGLTELQVKQFIEEAFLQMPVGEMTINDENLSMIVKWDEKIERKKDLLDLTIPTVEGEKQLSHFIEFQTVHTPNEITHTDGERYVSISADIEERDLGAINRDVQKLIEDFEVPTGYHVSVAGDLEEQQELMQEMILVFVIAIFLVYLVMAVQFNNLAHPIVVMSVIPMTIVGVILGLFLTQRELSVMSGIGVVMLIGIVLNNAILLVDRTNQLRRKGYDVQEALIEAGKNRIRPIFMTTLTTAGGMLPLALASGSSGNYQAPMATVIISGLLFATFITLLLIPAVYRIFSAIHSGFSKLRKGKQKKNNVTEAVN
ncbi:efflux RND transporter permease subunit [Bacillus alveayuensis]|uniref:efflux RND transporter permease subunit n=1 Tax=Aeribacillus alveayuensis TaxID=279215 RepID=UPI0005CCDAA4|nr:efflux RND transporter permease subunit [Bacillus alveayuensis]